MNTPDIRPGTKFNNVQFYKDILNYIKTRIVAGEGLNSTTVGDQLIISVANKKGANSISSGDTTIKRVPHLPSIDENMGLNKYKQVFWLSYDTGLEEGYNDADGDDQVWTLVFPQLRWYPEQKYTPNSGIPISG